MKETKQKKGAKANRKTGILSSRFYRIYFAVVAGILALIAIALIWLNGVVKDYEAAQPIHAARKIGELFENGDYESLYALDTSAGSIAEGDQAFYVESLSALTEGKNVAWSAAFSPEEDERRYNVTLDGDRFATFTLVPSGETSAYGRTLWTLGTVTTNVVLESDTLPPTQYRVRAPSTYTVTADGTVLGAGNVLSAGKAIVPDGFLPSDVTAPTMTEYGFASDSENPSVSVTDPSGEAVQVTRGEDGVWTCGLKENTEFGEKYAKKLISLGESIAKFTSKDLSSGAVRVNIASDSPAETIIKRFSNYWAPDHRSYSFKNEAVSHVIFLSDSCFIYQVNFDFIITTRRNSYPYPTEYTLCVINRKGKPKVYNIMFHGLEMD